MRRTSRSASLRRSCRAPSAFTSCAMACQRSVVSAGRSASASSRARLRRRRRRACACRANRADIGAASSTAAAAAAPCRTADGSDRPPIAVQVVVVGLAVEAGQHDAPCGRPRHHRQQIGGRRDRCRSSPAAITGSAGGCARQNAACAASSRLRRSAGSMRPPPARISGQASRQDVEEIERPLPMLGIFVGHQILQPAKLTCSVCTWSSSRASSAASRAAWSGGDVPGDRCAQDAPRVSSICRRSADRRRQFGAASPTAMPRRRRTTPPRRDRDRRSASGAAAAAAGRRPGAGTPRASDGRRAGSAAGWCSAPAPADRLTSRPAVPPPARRRSRRPAGS